MFLHYAILKICIEFEGRFQIKTSISIKLGIDLAPLVERLDQTSKAHGMELRSTLKNKTND